MTKAPTISVFVQTAFLLLLTTQTYAQDNTKVILNISGKIAPQAATTEVNYTLADLEAMPASTITTSTPWFDGVSHFEGVSLLTLLDTVSASGTTVTAIALNDYITNIPIDAIREHNPLLATKRDGQFMSIREKGPLFIVFNYDSKPELKNHQYYARSAWQVAKLVIE